MASEDFIMSVFNHPDMCGSGETEAEFKCHKLVLSAASPVFKAMFESDFEENKTNVVKIDDFDKEAVVTFLKVAYGSKKLALSLNLAKDVVMLSDKYQLAESLKDNLGSAVIENRLLKWNWDQTRDLAVYASKFKVPILRKAATAELVSLYGGREPTAVQLAPLQEAPDVLIEMFPAVLKNEKADMRQEAERNVAIMRQAAERAEQKIRTDKEDWKKRNCHCNCQVRGMWCNSWLISPNKLSIKPRVPISYVVNGIFKHKYEMARSLSGMR